ncbi:hypothetical protein SDJN03_28950, partial [Cucurbita argyrosperma subsp. sororia]
MRFIGCSSHSKNAVLYPILPYLYQKRIQLYGHLAHISRTATKVFHYFFFSFCKECVRTAQIYQTPSSKSFQIDEIRRFWTPPVAHQPNYAVFTCCLIRIAQVGYSITPVSVRPISFLFQRMALIALEN